MPGNPKRWLEPVARAGYAARGLVYLVIGILAILAAAGAAAKTDAEGALRALLGEPFGTAIVYLLAAGLACYVLWRCVQAILDTDGHGTSAKGLVVRAALMVSAVAYASLAVYALALLGVYGSASSASSSGAGAREQIAGVFTGLVGHAAVALVLAAVLAGVAVAHFWMAATRSYERRLATTDEQMRLITPVAITGLAARGAVFALISVLFVYRSATARDAARDPPGLAEALQFIQDMPLGGVLLAATGVGLVAFSAYSLVQARWRRITVRPG